MDLKDYISHEPFHVQPVDSISACSPSPVPLPLLSQTQTQSQSQFPSPDHPDPALQPSSLNHVMNNLYAEPGALSLHNYRRYMAHGGSSTSVDGHDFKRLRRKNAALNLNQPSDPPHSVSPFSVSSASSPPPLSPSSSPSAVSDLGAESLRGFLLSSTPMDLVSYERPGHRLNSYKILDTFRDRLESYPEPNPTPSIRGHSKTYSDSALLDVARDDSTVISHNGTSFEILNPHESLRFARIVSYIEDVDTYSSPGSSGHDHQRDSYISDDAIPIFDASFLGDDDDLLYAYPVGEDTYREDDITATTTAHVHRAHHDLVGDSPHHPMPSISERLEENDVESIASPDELHRLPYSPSPSHTCTHSRSYSYSHSHSHFHRGSRLWTPRSFDSSELGEPGSPVYEHEPETFRHSFWPKHHHHIPQSTTPTPLLRGHIHTHVLPRSSTPRKASQDAGKTGPLKRLCGLAMALRSKRFWSKDGEK
ncbi:hypothetical protein N8T08_000954 [Aspergillus melleus]|uniref:Uncharacterized protein n=1 Tax=Aspergillus melleus TaxID=138277 RepID=A0ACC3BAZ7_9EURO|nr:hypothetical protein N8T08_000954 [Aspergillus melleus]